MTRPALLLCLLASPAAALGDLPAGEFARYAAEICVQPDLSAQVTEAGDFEEVSRDESSATFEHPEGAEMTVFAEADTVACEIRVPGATEGWFDAVAEALSPMMAERFAAAAPESVEDGIVWDGVSPGGVELTTEFRLLEDGAAVLTSRTQALRGDEPEL